MKSNQNRMSGQEMFAGGITHASEQPDHFFRIIRTHQCFTDQGSVYADPFELNKLLAAGDAGFRNYRGAGRDICDQVVCGLNVDDASVEVPVVDPDNFRSGFNCPFEFIFVVDFDQAIKIQLRSLELEITQPVVVQDSRDQKYSIRATDRSLKQLVLVNHKILAEDREAACGTGRGQIFKPSIEMDFIGQHREGRGSTGFVGPDLVGQFHPGSDRAGAGRLAFEFTDQGHPRTGQSLAEGAVLITLAKTCPELIQRQLPTAILHALGRSRNQLFKYSHSRKKPY